MKILVRFIWTLLVTAGVMAPASAADPIIIKFSHVVANETPKGRAALRFKEVLEKRTNGRVKVEIFPNSKLYNEQDGISALLEGSDKVHMLAPAVSNLVRLGADDFEVFDLPYIFPGDDLRRRITDGPIGQGMLRKLEGKGITGLGYWGNGFRAISANQPLKKPGDIKGLSIGIPRSKILEATMTALGVTPKFLRVAEAREAMKTGTLDGSEVIPSNFYTQKLHEAQKYLTLTNHTYLSYAVITNKKFWDSLPGDIRIHIKLAMIDATRYANLYAENENNDALTKLRASGKTQVVDLSLDERNAWRRALLPIHKKLEAQIGKELIQSIYKEGASLGYKF